VRLLAAESAALVGFLPRLVWWQLVRSVVVVGWLVVGAVRVDLMGALLVAPVAVFLMRIFGLRWRIVPVRPLGSRTLTKKNRFCLVELFPVMFLRLVRGYCS
jgi:hypothetical protein